MGGFCLSIDLEKENQKQEVIIITGPAGAGRTTAIKAVEDFGIEAIDNLPLNLINRILFGPPTGDRLAIGVDTRTRGFSSEALLEVIDVIEQNPHYQPILLYLDCRPDTLLRRFSETRRRHPASPDGSPDIGIEQEAATLNLLRERAGILIDTSDFSPHQLRAEMGRLFDRSKGRGLAVNVRSFSYKRGTPRGIDMMIDCRFLRNPHWEPELKNLTGLAPQVGQYVAKDPLFEPFFSKLVDMCTLLLPAYSAEGKAYFSIGLGCTGGQHRSVFVAEKLARALSIEGWVVSTRHREMDRWPMEAAQK